jgi:Spy/CpxP family protein refolding chaperone
MRSRITRIGFFLITTAAMALAQTAGDSTADNAHFYPAQALARRIDMLATLLSLTEAQKTQATTIFQNEQTAVSALQTQVSAANTALRDAVKSNKTDTEIDTLAAAVGTLNGRALAIHTKASAAFYRILTAEQKVKYDTLRPMGMGGPGMGGPGMGGRGMGPGGRNANRN